MKREGRDSRGAGRQPVLEWDAVHQNRLTVGDTHFNVTEMLPAPNDVRIVIKKNRAMLESIAQLVANDAPRNVVELGIAQGGSTAFLAQIAQPERLVAIEIDPTPVPALDAFIAAHELRDQVRPYYGVDQADRARLEAIVELEFGAMPLDLVCDDASHILDLTRASFNVLFPRLRAGGSYVIEDWIWGHYGPGGPRDFLTFDEESAEWRALLQSGPPLSVLVFELIMTCASTAGIVDELTIGPYFVHARRGAADLDPTTFDVSRAYEEGPVKLLAPELTGER